MTNMPTYRQITQPLARETKPDVATHADIDWRKVTVAEAIDADRQRSLEAKAKLKTVYAARKSGKTTIQMGATRKRGFWATFCQVFGARS